MIQKLSEWWGRFFEPHTHPPSFVRSKLSTELPLIVGPQGEDMFEVWEAEARSKREQEDAQRYLLTEEHGDWLDKRAFWDRDVVSINRNDDLWHGYRGQKLVLNNTQALWLSRTKEVAEEYRDFGGVGGGGVIHVRPLRLINLISSDINGVEFIEKFDLGRHHDHFSRRLHAWAIMRNIPGIMETSGHIVLFRAYDLVEEVR